VTACIQDPRTGNPYPPTVQHQTTQTNVFKIPEQGIRILQLHNIRQHRQAAKNIISLIIGRGVPDTKKTFDHKRKGMMALIGERNGVGIAFGHKVYRFTAWWF
jgi:NADH dehydrogenase FAD-containing subunit